MFWLLAVVCWINDRVFCSLWAGLGFPYLHAAWHVLVFLASYTAVVIFAFFDAKQRRKGLKAEIRLVVIKGKVSQNSNLMNNLSYTLFVTP